MYLWFQTYIIDFNDRNEMFVDTALFYVRSPGILFYFMAPCRIPRWSNDPTVCLDRYCLVSITRMESRVDPSQFCKYCLGSRNNNPASSTSSSVVYVNSDATGDRDSAQWRIQGGPQGAMAPPQTMDKNFFTLSNTNHW